MRAAITFRSEQKLTQDQFFEWLQDLPASDINHYELIHGRIVMSPPAGFVHASTDASLLTEIANFVKRHDLGRVLDASCGYDLPSGDTLEPDVSFVAKRKLAAAKSAPGGRFTRVVPDLVVETLSPSTARRDRTVKKDIYAANGVREYWLVDVKRKEVTIFHLRGKEYDAGTILRDGIIASKVLPGLKIRLRDVFEP